MTLTKDSTFAEMVTAVEGLIVGVPALTGDAAVGDVLANKTFYNDDLTKLTGTMVDRGTGDYSGTLTNAGTTTIKLAIPTNAYYGTSANITHTDANRVAGNIKSGVTLDGVVGTLPDGTGKKSYVSGSISVPSASLTTVNFSFNVKELCATMLYSGVPALNAVYFMNPYSGAWSTLASGGSFQITRISDTSFQFYQTYSGSTETVYYYAHQQ